MGETVTAIVLVVAFLFIVFILPSIRNIGATEVGLVTKRFGFKKLSEDNPIAVKGGGGLPVRTSHAGLPVEVLDHVPGTEVPLGAGAHRRDRGGDRPGGQAPAGNVAGTRMASPSHGVP